MRCHCWFREASEDNSWDKDDDSKFMSRWKWAYSILCCYLKKLLYCARCTFKWPPVSERLSSTWGFCFVGMSCTLSSNKSNKCVTTLLKIHDRAECCSCLHTAIKDFTCINHLDFSFLVRFAKHSSSSLLPHFLNQREGESRLRALYSYQHK